MASGSGVRATLARLASVGGTLISRDIAVLTNAIAFNFLLCLFPLLVVVASASQRLPEGRGARAGTALLLLLEELIPFGREAMAESVKNLTRIATKLEALSLVLIVWGSSGIFMPVEMALNRAWGGRPRTFWKSRGLAFLMTVAGGLLVLGSIALTIAARSQGREWPRLAAATVKLSAFALSYVLFFLIYRVIPDVPEVGTRVALRAAFWSAAAWEGVKYLFVIKLGQMNLQAFYGPLALSVSLLLWAYVSSLVLVFGALMVPVSAAAERPSRRRKR